MIFESFIELYLNLLLNQFRSPMIFESTFTPFWIIFLSHIWIYFWINFDPQWFLNPSQFNFESFIKLYLNLLLNQFRSPMIFESTFTPFWIIFLSHIWIYFWINFDPQWFFNQLLLHFESIFWVIFESTFEPISIPNDFYSILNHFSESFESTLTQFF